MATPTEDRDEILQLLYRYNHAIDSGDAEGWADTFTEDGLFEGPVPGGLRGRAQLVEFASGVSGIRHMVLNPLVDVDGDTAGVRAYILVLAGGQVVTVGTYDDTVVRTPAGWRFSRRLFTPDPPDA